MTPDNSFIENDTFFGEPSQEKNHTQFMDINTGLVKSRFAYNEKEISAEEYITQTREQLLGLKGSSLMKDMKLKGAGKKMREKPLEERVRLFINSEWGLTQATYSEHSLSEGDRFRKLLVSFDEYFGLNKKKPPQKK
ncbi:MAG: hypothetical protein UT39_C0025G0012 [Candidatus Woesebacteria bacterium GW2011_GWA1_39_21]|uniref:Uncharacterized protein n=1 Tax=Candidatus Woesebacteria bacterium GW2011_GWA1_39_21 TaxID=1618550 RepID=A0A0G0N124_9BACT|nr:MAG: hypothetical protein UT39_C0025G0012 [Candidatus Woesebacteria bacterium GW2011_GWA1_39_21]